MTAASGGASRGSGLLLLVVVAGLAALLASRSDWLPLTQDPAARAESDFELHWAAGQALAEGRDAYDPAVVDEIGRRAGRDYTPFCAANPLVVRLFGGMDGRDFGGEYKRWFVASCCVLAGATLLLGRAVRQAAAARGAPLPVTAGLAIAIGAVALNDGTWMGLFYNQLNAVTLYCVVAALAAGLAGRPRVEGVFLALAACAKTSPALLIVCAALAGRWRTVRAAAVACAVLLAVSVAWSGWAIHATWWRVVLPKLGYAAVVQDEFNNSLHAWNLAPNGLLSLAAQVRGWSFDAVWLLCWVLTAAVIAALAGAVRGGRGRRDLFAQYALGVVAGFLVSSVTWPTHLSLAAIPVAWLALLAQGGLARRQPAVMGLAALACLVLFLPLGTLASVHGTSFDTQAKAGACILLFACVLALARGSDSGDPAILVDAMVSGPRGGQP